MTHIEKLIEELKNGGRKYSSRAAAIRAARKVINYYWATGAHSALYEPYHWQWVNNGIRTNHLHIDTDDNTLQLS